MTAARRNPRKSQRASARNIAARTNSGGGGRAGSRSKARGSRCGRMARGSRAFSAAAIKQEDAAAAAEELGNVAEEDEDEGEETEKGKCADVQIASSSKRRRHAREATPQLP